MAKLEWQARFDLIEEETEIIPMDLTHRPVHGDAIRTSRGPYQIIDINDYHHYLDVIPGTAIQPLSI